jgi:DNA repair protein SbcC/Rad50
MIPVRLKLHNFMPYRDASLDFTGLHLAVITGDNGNGKSSIVDAITWALWGKARAASDDDLIHAGQPEMEVEFEFQVGEQGYRIIRKRSKPKKKTGAGQSVLEFQVKNGDDYRAITGGIMTETQQKIIEVLHMDYDTFVNSAFLRQGRADEFTRQQPAKRKEVLASILGLGVYDDLEEKAKEQARAHEADNARYESTINEMNAELAHAPGYAAELEKAETALTEIDQAARSKEAALNALRQKKERLENIRAQLNQLEESASARAADLKRWQTQALQHAANTKKYENIISRREEIVSGYARSQAVKKETEVMDKKFRQSVNQEKLIASVIKKMDEIKNGLTTELTVIQRDIARLEALTQTLPDLKVQSGQVQARAAKLTEAEVTLKQKEQVVTDAKAAIIRLETDIARLEKEALETNDKLTLINTHIASHTEAKCPLCETPLTREGLELLAEKYRKEKLDKTDALNRSRLELKQQKVSAEALFKEKTYFETRLNEEKNKNNNQDNIIKQKIKDIEENAAKLAGLRETGKALEWRLVGRDYAAFERQALDDFEDELRLIDYDAARHEEVRQRQRELERYEREKTALDEAERLVQQERNAEAGAQEAAFNLQENLAKDNAKKDSLAAELTGLPQVAQELAVAEQEYQTISGQRANAQQAVGSVKSRLERLAELENRKKEYGDHIAQAAREESIYKELARAFGKNGIQALIIDSALPELEQESNRLLARLTDSRMSLKFETQRTTKKDVLKETLDIIVGDELGTRDYEMFSGGEAFRINFAVRIALSRLLARRAGAPLPTIIIDEGFGTQDAAGMEKLKEAIISIQDDFEKILVITHMDDLKDAFPNRIDVVKTATGSAISVS